MSTFSLLLRGLLLGLSVAAPVGAIGVLVIRRTLAQGRLAGLVSGLGAATADAVYGTIAGLGLTLITDALIEASFWTRLVGGLFLLYLGARAFQGNPATPLPVGPAPDPDPRGLLGAYATTLFLTLANPATIVAFIGIMAGAGIGDTGGSYTRAATLVGGVFLGSTLWWIALSSAVGLVRGWVIQPRAMRWINRVSGLVIMGFGLFTLVQVLRGAS